VVGHGGQVQPRWRGLPAHGRGGDTVSCASPACVQRGGRRAGVAKPRQRGKQKGGCALSLLPLPLHSCKGWRVARKLGEGEQPGRRGLLVNGNGGRTLCLPCPQRACKGGGHAGGAGRGGVQPG